MDFHIFVTLNVFSGFNVMVSFFERSEEFTTNVLEF